MIDREYAASQRARIKQLILFDALDAAEESVGLSDVDRRLDQEAIQSVAGRVAGAAPGEGRLRWVVVPTPVVAGLSRQAALVDAGRELLRADDMAVTDL